MYTLGWIQEYEFKVIYCLVKMTNRRKITNDYVGRNGSAICNTTDLNSGFT